MPILVEIEVVVLSELRMYANMKMSYDVSKFDITIKFAVEKERCHMVRDYLEVV